MNRFLKLGAGALILAILLTVGLTGMAFAEEENTFELQVSPNTYNLLSNGGSVTLHAAIVYSVSYDLDLTLTYEIEGVVHSVPVPVLYTFADDRGQLVIKCSLASIFEPGDIESLRVEATFDLTIDSTYTGADAFTVIARGK